jgi:uncharacterized protein
MIRLREHYLKYPQTHSENMFTTLIAWMHHTPAYYLQKNGSLLLMHMKDGTPHFRPPIGGADVALLKDVLALAKEKGGPRPVVVLDEAARERIELLYPGIKVTPERDFFDYVYLARDLAGLPGQPYRVQRGRLNRFRKQYAYSVEEVSDGNISEVNGFIDRWCKQHGCDANPLLEAEVGALKYCTGHFTALGLSGITVRIGGTIQALSVYEPVNGEAAAIHFEKAMPEYDGLYSVVNNEAAKLLQATFKYINRESDLGIAGLRTAKERLHPHHMENVYSIGKDSLPG